jgi:pSer/pThr/pTyr-binding forkhead associated (FHA) protein
MHLESAPRREDFRRIRARVQGAIGQRTLVGDVRVDPAGATDRTFPSIESAVGKQAGVCSLLFNGEQLPLRVGLNSVGRLPDNDIILDDDTVSRRHCAIVVHSNLSVELYDIASKNGTKINGSKIKGPTTLTDGDEINICGCKMLFVLKSGTPTVNHSSIQLHLSDDITLIN